MLFSQDHQCAKYDFTLDSRVEVGGESRDGSWPITLPEKIAVQPCEI